MLRGPLEPTSHDVESVADDEPADAAPSPTAERHGDGDAVTWPTPFEEGTAAGWAVLFGSGSLIGPISEDDARAYAESPSVRLVRWYDPRPHAD